MNLKGVAAFVLGEKGVADGGVAVQTCCFDVPAVDEGGAGEGGGVGGCEAVPGIAVWVAIGVPVTKSVRIFATSTSAG